MIDLIQSIGILTLAVSLILSGLWIRTLERVIDGFEERLAMVEDDLLDECAERVMRDISAKAARQ